MSDKEDYIKCPNHCGEYLKIKAFKNEPYYYTGHCGLCLQTFEIKLIYEGEGSER